MEKAWRRNKIKVLCQDGECLTKGNQAFNDGNGQGGRVVILNLQSPKVD